MLVKIFDEEHEQDLEESVNEFLRYINNVIDIKYSVAIMNDYKTNEQKRQENNRNTNYGIYACFGHRIFNACPPSGNTTA